jgi:hypothetical protein
MIDIATATRCSCGAPIHVSETAGPTDKAWAALCRDCYDGTDDAGASAHVRGFGATPDDALWAWQDMHDGAHEVEWCLADLVGEIARQVSAEHDRQRGWVVCTAGTERDRTQASPRYYSPPLLPIGLAQ